MEATPWRLACVIIAHCDPFYRQTERWGMLSVQIPRGGLALCSCLSSFLVQQRDSGQRHRELRGKHEKTLQSPKKSLFFGFINDPDIIIMWVFKSTKIAFLPISGRYAVQSFVTLQLSSEAELGDRPAACMLNV